ncbi:uncharacterized protein LOC143893538 isoform X1 [Temnothorax americanus]|uniref:uncharacterized protein LOC143893538 isoform X1 n=1 Tax=Temnothorax americanus TaxID=1964332 RepID=UPI0040693AB5
MRCTFTSVESAFRRDVAGNMMRSVRGYNIAINLQDQSLIEVCLPDTEACMSSTTDCEHSPFLDNSKKMRIINKLLLFNLRLYLLFFHLKAIHNRRKAKPKLLQMLQYGQISWL